MFVFNKMKKQTDTNPGEGKDYATLGQFVSQDYADAIFLSVGKRGEPEYHHDESSARTVARAIVSEVHGVVSSIDDIDTREVSGFDYDPHENNPNPDDRYPVKVTYGFTFYNGGKNPIGRVSATVIDIDFGEYAVESQFEVGITGGKVPGFLVDTVDRAFCNGSGLHLRRDGYGIKGNDGDEDAFAIWRRQGDERTIYLNDAVMRMIHDRLKPKLG